eukprot:2421313-Amphidinium_carterae.1
MKTHHADRDAEEGRAQLSDLQGNRMADTAANNGTRMCLLNFLRNGSIGALVRLPAPEPVPVEVVTVAETNLPAAPLCALRQEKHKRPCIEGSGLQAPWILPLLRQAQRLARRASRPALATCLPLLGSKEVFVE